MPKMKTHRATAKRFRITRNGKVLHRKATGNHMLTKKSGSRRRRVEGMAEVTSERRSIRRLLGK
ncbi:MAG: 50S ribosomal protein L35 [Actinomycetota bacterium]|jgi:large subunit ribosomal protein L35|nr:50S ribosomal protein L35 [Actinomycetota bacterium]